MTPSVRLSLLGYLPLAYCYYPRIARRSAVPVCVLLPLALAGVATLALASPCFSRHRVWAAVTARCACVPGEREVRGLATAMPCQGTALGPFSHAVVRELGYLL